VIISLTWRQLQSARHWASERQRPLLLDSVQVGKAHRVAMPFTAWRALSVHMQEEAYTKWGRGQPSKMTGPKAGTMSAIRAIERECCRIEGHPALRGEGVMGCSFDHLVVWKSRITGNLWQVTPAPLEVLRVLVPVYDDGLIVTAGEATWKPPDGITFWEATDPGEIVVTPPGLFANQDDHLGWD
jgi:hypothetical protein